MLLARRAIVDLVARIGALTIYATVCGLAFGCFVVACRAEESDMSDDEWIAVRDQAEQLTAAGRHDEALLAARHAVDVARSSFGAHDPRVIAALDAVAGQLEGQLTDASDGRREELVAALNERLALLLAQPAPSDMEVLAARRQLVRWQLAFRRFDESKAQLTLIFEQLTRLHGKDSFELTREQALRGLDLVRAGASALAEPLLVTALPTLRDRVRGSPGQVIPGDAREIFQSVLRALAAEASRTDDATKYRAELDGLGP